MKRRVFLIGLASAATVVAGPAMANPYADDVVGQLTNEGFSNVAVGTTWLGRIRITAQRQGGTREIILNPRTGEVLRDTWTAADGTIGTKPIIDNITDNSSGGGGNGGNGGSGSSGSDGSGSGSSGSGGTGAGTGTGTGSGSGSGNGGGGDGGKDDNGGKDK